MWLRYLIPSFRILWRSRFTTGINIAGLSVGICSCLIIYMYVSNAWNVDQHHSKKDRTYRIVSDMRLGGEDAKIGLASYMLPPGLKRDYPEVEEAIRLMPVNKQTVWVENRPFQFENNLMADEGFFHIFDYEFVEGNSKTALKEPQSVVITDEVALKLFGRTNGLLGQTIQYARLPYTITGVVKDRKDISHLYFNTILSISSLSPQMKAALEGDWFYMAQANYVLFKKAEDAIGFDRKLAQFRDRYIVPWTRSVNTDGKLSFHIQPLTDIYLSKDYQMGYIKSGNTSYLLIFSIVAVFVLLLACINYVNLATATAAKRAREIGIRKTAGAYNSLLFRQFIVESMLTTCIAILVALLLVHALLPLFNWLTEKTLVVPYSASMVGVLLFLLLFNGLVAGAYPALYLSGMDPVKVLKVNKMPGGISSVVRKSLVVFQFFISASFIVCTLVVYSQMHLMKNASLGFDKDQILVFAVPTADSSFVNRFDVVRNELSQSPDILKIAGTSNIPGRPTGTLIHLIQTPGKPSMEKGINYMVVSHDFLDIMNIKLAQGRNFSRDFQADDSAAFIVNQAALRTYAWSNPLSSTMENGLGYKGNVVGVVNDFNYASLHKTIEPLVIMLDKRLSGFLMLKVKAGREGEAIRFAKGVWEKYSHRYPTEYFFLDENFNNLYRSEERMMTIFTYFSLLSILISCLGLFALVTFSLEQRTKEIGIRQVLGASIPDILKTMTADYVVLIAAGVLLAFPLSWYFMNRWLADFATRTTISWWVFVGAGALLMAIAGITMVIRILKSAQISPVRSLRYE